MGQIKRRTFILASGKQIKMTGSALCIAPSLEIGEGFTNNIFGVTDHIANTEKPKSFVHNPYQLTCADIIEVADMNIRLWMDLKDAVRENGTSNTGIFRKKE